MNHTLLSAPMSAILHQRGFTLFHASAVKQGAFSVAIIGHAGAGKSTLAAKCVANGFELLTDDICAIKLDTDDTIMIYPSYPTQKLWEQSLQKLAISSNTLERVHKQIDKYLVEQTPAFQHTQTPLTHIIFLTATKENMTGVDVTRADRLISIFSLGQHLYFRQSMADYGLSGDMLNLLATIVQKTDCCHITRPPDENTISELFEIMESLLV